MILRKSEMSICFCYRRTELVPWFQTSPDMNACSGGKWAPNRNRLANNSVPSCLQNYQQRTKVATRERVKDEVLSNQTF